MVQTESKFAFQTEELKLEVELGMQLEGLRLIGRDLETTNPEWIRATLERLPSCLRFPGCSGWCLRTRVAQKEVLYNCCGWIANVLGDFGLLDEPEWVYCILNRRIHC